MSENESDWRNEFRVVSGSVEEIADKMNEMEREGLSPSIWGGPAWAGTDRGAPVFKLLISIYADWSQGQPDEYVPLAPEAP